MSPVAARRAISQSAVSQSPRIAVLRTVALPAIKGFVAGRWSRNVQIAAEIGQDGGSSSGRSILERMIWLVSVHQNMESAQQHATWNIQGSSTRFLVSPPVPDWYTTSLSMWSARYETRRITCVNHVGLVVETSPSQFLPSILL